MEKEKIECCSENQVHPDLLKIVNDTMPEETELYDLAELFKVFGDSTRIRILFVLFEAEVCVCDLAAALSMTQSAISHQLRILKQNKLNAAGRENLFFIPWQMTTSGQSLHRAGSILRKMQYKDDTIWEKRTFAVDVLFFVQTDLNIYLSFFKDSLFWI